MISQSVGSSPVSGSVLTAHSLDPASDSVCVCVCVSVCVCLCVCVVLFWTTLHSRYFLKKNSNSLVETEKILLGKLKKAIIGAPGWLSRLRVRLRLRS